MPPMSNGCRVEGCERDFYARNMCNAHYRRLLKGWSEERLTETPIAEPYRAPGPLDDDVFDAAKTLLRTMET